MQLMLLLICLQDRKKIHSTFSVTNDLQISLNDFGVGNVLRIDRNTLKKICIQ